MSKQRIYDLIIAIVFVGGAIFGVVSLISVAMGGNWYVLFYLLVVIGGINVAANWIAGLSGVLVGIVAITHIVAMIGEADGEDTEKIRSVTSTIFWRFLPYFSVSLLLAIAAPTQKEMAVVIAGGSVGQFIMDDENAKEIPHDIVRLVRKEILEATADMPQEAREELGIKSEKERLQEKSEDELLDMLKSKGKEELINYLTDEETKSLTQ
jgi:hypothetical protein